MEVMGMIAVLVNCALVGLNGPLGRMWPHLDPLETLALVVLVEHLLLLLKSAIAFAIPDVPHWVQTEMAKVEFQRREAARVRELLSSALTFFISTVCKAVRLFEIAFVSKSVSLK